MKDTHHLSGRMYLRYFFAVAVFALVCFVAGVTVFLQVSYGLKQGALSRLELAVSKLDDVIQNAGKAAEGVAVDAGKECTAEVRDALRYQVAIVPDVRTVSLAKDNVIYCSSIYTSIARPSSKGFFVRDQLLLLGGNQLTPGKPVLIYRRDGDNDNSVLVGIDGYYVHNILRLLSYQMSLSMTVGNTQMDMEGKVTEQPLKDEGTVYRRASANYPFMVSTTVPRVLQWSVIKEYSLGSIILFPLLAIVLAFLTWRFTGWLMSPALRIREGLRRNEFVPWLQPVVTPEGKLSGCEVLVRWVRPGLGVQTPYHFILEAEESGLIVPMTHDLMMQVKTFFSSRQESLPDGFHFAFNVQARHFDQSEIVDDCCNFLAAFDRRKVSLILELTERQEIVRSEKNTAIIKRLREAGVLMAIDDFGTGHSSLTYLKERDFDLLKLDQSFIRNIHSGDHSRHIVRQLAELAGQLKMKTIAEGVETEEQLKVLREYPIDYIQGYLFGRPVDMATFARSWLQK
ncbi:TPA: EAL domain-containing protein [Citrobacter freundii]|nr:EAL domain-containing protein [Citrobacter freundii]